ncbi:hypothetical protein WJX77_012571 [Trebouxia sp. C0004]
MRLSDCFSGQPAHEPLMQTRHGHVKGHTKGIDIFSKDFILIPAHKGLHWTLIVVCYPSPAYKGQHRGVLHLDSLPGLRRGMRKYVQDNAPEEWWTYVKQVYKKSLRCGEPGLRAKDCNAEVVPSDQPSDRGQSLPVPWYLSAHAYLPFAKEAEQHRAKALVAVKSLQKQPLDDVVDLT